MKGIYTGMPIILGNWFKTIYLFHSFIRISHAFRRHMYVNIREICSPLLSIYTIVYSARFANVAVLRGLYTHILLAISPHFFTDLADIWAAN